MWKLSCSKYHPLHNERCFIVMSIVNKKGSQIRFFKSSIVTNNKLILLTIKGKCIEVIVNMIKFEILNLAPPTEVRLFISIHVYDKNSIVADICPC